MAEDTHLGQPGQGSEQNQGFDVEELDDKNLEGVAGGDLAAEEGFAADPGNGCVNNASHC